MVSKKRRRTKEDDIRDVLLELCRASGSEKHTVTGLAKKLHINKGQVSTAIRELGAYTELEIGYRGSHTITLKHDIPTLELLYREFDGDFRAQDGVMESDCFRDAAITAFDRFCETISEIKYNVYLTWSSDQPATPEEQKIFEGIRRDTERAHIYEPSLRGTLSDPPKAQHERIAPPDMVGGKIEISEADRQYIKDILAKNWLGVKFLLVVIDPENDTICLVERFMSFIVEKRKLRCLDRHDAAIHGYRILAPCSPNDPIDYTHGKQLEEYITTSIPVVDVRAFFLELDRFYRAFPYLL